MAKKRFDFSEALASSMDSIMNDDSYRSLYEAPKFVTASDKSYGEDPVGNAVETLLLASQLLESVGLQKSASKTLETIDILISEAMEQEEDEDSASADDSNIKEESDDSEDKGAEIDVSFADDDDDDDEKDDDDADVPPSI